MRRLRALAGDRSGAAAVEYGLIIAAVAGAILFVLFIIGSFLNSARMQGSGGSLLPSRGGEPDGGFLHHGTGTGGSGP